MIKINLMNGVVSSGARPGEIDSLDGVMMLSSEETRKEALKKIAVLLIFPAGLYFYEQQIIPDMNSKLAVINSELNVLSSENSKNQEIVEKIQKIKEGQKLMEQRLSLVKKIDGEKGREIRILDLFQNVIPETVWFRSLEYQGSSFNIRGYALSDSDVSSFVESLSKSIHFKEVNLVNSTEEKIEEKSLESFEIKCLTEAPKAEVTR